MSSDIPVLIAGAGPAGLVMALSLAHNGIKVRIIDRDISFHTGSRGFGIQPRTFELFQSLGILSEVQARATEIPTMRAYKLPGGVVPIKTWDLYEKGTTWPDRPYGNGACLSQYILEEIMRDNLKKFGVFVELGTELIVIKQSEDAITCTLSHNFPDDKREEIVTANYLVGSDGAKGLTRKLLGLTFQGETRDADGMVWGDVDIPNLESDFWHIWGKPGHFTIMARPLSLSGHTFGLGLIGQNFDPVNLAQPEKLVDFIKEETGRDLSFGKFSWFSYFKPNMRMANKFQDGRAFLSGDSAHVHSPTGGQGMNCSVQDSLNLAWKLALVIKGISPPSLLSTYDEERIPVIAQMIHATSKLYTHAVAKEKAADTTEATENEKSSGWFRWRNDALQLYGINYRFSRIVIDERRKAPLDPESARARAYEGYEGLGSLQAGDRVPDAPGLVANGSETSVFALLKPNLHTLLIFVSEATTDIAKQVLSAVSIYPEGVLQSFVLSNTAIGALEGKGTLLIDRDGHGFKSFLMEDGEAEVVIIRPDMFIGAIVKNAEGVKNYFSKILKQVS